VEQKLLQMHLIGNMLLSSRDKTVASLGSYTHKHVSSFAVSARVMKSKRRTILSLRN